MGYYYDTVLTLDQAAHKELQTAIKNGSDDIEELFEGCDHCEIDPKTKAVLYHWSFSKWSDGEKEIVMNVLKDFEEEQYRFLQLGEQLGDYEWFGEMEEPFEPSVICELKYNTINETSNNKSTTVLNSTKEESQCNR